MRGYTFVSIVLLVSPVFLAGGYYIPEVTVEALNNGEFRVYIPDSKGITLFAPHAKINEKIDIHDRGDYFDEITAKTGNFWIAKFSNSNLKAGDIVYLWVSVIAESLGYRKDGVNVTIKELFSAYPKLQATCIVSKTVFDGGKQGCIGDQIIFDQFQGPQIDGNRWVSEQWIPTNTAPYFIFNSYINKEETRFINDNILYLKPIDLKTDYEVRGTLDLTLGCTSKVPSECSVTSKSWQLLPPVKSAKLTSKISFKYGKVEIRAKLPEGDWLFPVIQLEQKIKENGRSSPTIWIAYSRGNDVLRASDKTDIGSRLLFGGPVLFPSEPVRSQHLVSRRGNNPFNKDFHVYSLEWIPGKMTLKVDGVEYGSVDLSKGLTDEIDFRGGGSATPEAPYHTEYLLTLGVAVGGLLDFPDNYKSGEIAKPWLNAEPGFIKEFFRKRSQWSTTWHGDNAALQVDYVKVTAV